MADVFIDRSTDYDGSGAALSAAGSILITLSGTLGANVKRKPVMTVYSRSGTADYVATYQQEGFGRRILDLAASDDYFFMVTSIESDASVDLSVADIA